MTPFPDAVQRADERAFLALHRFLHELPVHDVMRFVGQLGNGAGVLVIALAMLACDRDLRRVAGRMALVGLALLLVGGVLHVGKKGLPRHRPAQALAAEFAAGDATLEYGDARLYGSFPSGHAATAFALAVLMHRWARGIPGAARRRTVIVGIYALATCVGLERIYAGAHFPLDVLAGALAGALVAWGLAALAGLALDPRVVRLDAAMGPRP